MLLKYEKDTLDDRECFIVIHPLDDAPETKRVVSQLGPIRITPAVRWSLIALRAYLLGMAGLLLYHFIDLIGVLHR